jgi:hypothetical protein
MRWAWFVILAASATMAPAKTPTNPVDQLNLMSSGDRLDQLDRFRDGLSLSDRTRLDKALPRNAEGGIAQCDEKDESLASCEAAAYLPALRSTGLMPRFLATLAAKHS